MLGKQASPDVSQVRPWLTAATGMKLSPFGLGTPKRGEGALVDWMLFPGPPEARF